MPVNCRKIALAKDGISIDTGSGLYVLSMCERMPVPAMQKRTTVSSQVRVLDTAFFMPQLRRHRRIWIYLPKSYTISHQSYPVLYLQDGQNVFDEVTSFSGEWGVDETLDHLEPGTKECIVVAIDNAGDRRIQEYMPYDTEPYGKGEGNQYLDFIVKTLKPYIERNFRVQSSANCSFIAGSSAGGLIAFYALLKYPHTFGGAGVFSPSFWLVPPLHDRLAAMAKQVGGKIYFYAGEQESETLVPDMMAVYEVMKQNSHANMITVVRPDGKHTEASWRQAFPPFYHWLMSEEGI